MRGLLKDNPEIVRKFNKLWKSVFLQIFFYIENANKMNLGKDMSANLFSVIYQLIFEAVNLTKLNVGFSVIFSDFLISNIYS